MFGDLKDYLKLPHDGLRFQDISKVGKVDEIVDILGLSDCGGRTALKSEGVDVEHFQSWRINMSRVAFKQLNVSEQFGPILLDQEVAVAYTVD